MATGSPETPVEAAGENEKRWQRERPHGKRADGVGTHATFAAWYQFQDEGHADGKRVNRQCGDD